MSRAAKCVACGDSFDLAWHGDLCDECADAERDEIHAREVAAARAERDQLAASAAERGS